MALAVLATSVGPGIGNHLVLLVTLIVGALIGWYVANRVQMTEMPQLVAALHSFVGLAAVFIGLNANLELQHVSTMDEQSRAALTGFAAMLAHKTAEEVSLLKIE